MRFEWYKKADKVFSKLEKKEQTRVLDKLDEIEQSDDPISFLTPYTHDMSGLYKLRVGKNRLINLIIEDGEVAYVIVFEHRSKSYSTKTKKNIISIVDKIMKNREQ